jgi:hypothetical protein
MKHWKTLKKEERTVANNNKQKCNYKCIMSRKMEMD